MGGIAGIFHPATPKPIDPARIAAMTDALAHRGPDGQGTWVAPGVGLGHRRLAIIDLAGSAQPMASADGSLVVSYDGEIYNFRALRGELEEMDARFLTDGDTEVLLHGWRAWGADLLGRLDGMFAFALYDASDRSLFLARDRMGVKPLHLTELSDGSVAFASELKGLLANPLLKRSPDLRAVEDYLALGYVPDDACFVAGVHKLPPGHFLHLKRGQRIASPARWWTLDFSQRAKGAERDLEAELLDRMRAAVRSRMTADVPLGALLSGGIDSAAIVALMAETSPKAVKTSTIGFDDPDHDERDYAQQVAQRFATDHHEATRRIDDVGLIGRLVNAFDEPFADPGALVTCRMFELARQGTTVTLTGYGADEAFAGYRRYRSYAAEERARGLLPVGLRSAVGRLGAPCSKAGTVSRIAGARATLLAIANDGGRAYAEAIGDTSADMRDHLYSQAARTALGGYRGEQRYIDTMAAAPADEALDRAQYADFQHWLPGNLLTKLDRISMAVGLEAREPLLDHHLVEFAVSLPASMRIRQGQGKWLMRRALAQHLPKDILQRPQAAFSPPVSVWFRGSLADQAAALSSSRALLETGWFTPASLAKLAVDHRTSRADHGRTLWKLLMLEKALVRVFG